MLRAIALSLVLLGASSSHGGGSGKVFLTRDEALKLAFGESAIEHATYYLTDAQRERASERAGFDVDEKIAHAYIARKDGKVVGTAWFDVHEVRTKKQSLMVVVDAEQKISRIELLAFAEPLEYIPRGSWYAQFVGKQLDEELSMKRGIRGVSGATLTARATTRAARRMLALHAVVADAARPAPDEPEDAKR